MRICTKCLRTLPLECFYKNKKGYLGVKQRCKECIKNISKSKKERERRNIASRRFYKRNKQKVIDQINHINANRDSGLFRIYWGAYSRCNYKSHSNYSYYGGRGIKMLWKSYSDFREDMFESYIKHIEDFGKKNTTLDRLDTNGNYEISNCRWATLIEQANNRRNSIRSL